MTTGSVCPICLAPLPALRAREGTDVYLAKSCPEHGEFRTVIWRGPPEFESWWSSRPPVRPEHPQTATNKGCPHDCGLCSQHAQRSCCVLLELTSRCNLGCPVCFASAGETPAPDPTLAEIEGWYRLLLDSAGVCNIQLSGGEPTLRDDLADLITLGRRLGFSFFQLNTNGLRLAAQPGYAAHLRDAGLSTVFLQFDGLDDDVYHALRGAPLLEIKETAIAECGRAGLGVVLVPTLVPGVNTGQIGRIIRYAIDGLPYIRGVHFQPISYFGRYPEPPADGDRYTLPELLRDLEEQTDGLIPMAGFCPSGCEHSLCSFHGDFLLLPGGRVRTLSDPQRPSPCCCAEDAPAAVAKARDYVARRWSLDAAAMDSRDTCGCGSDDDISSLDAFLNRMRTHRFTITAMAFQDAWTLDLERLRSCCVHVVAPGPEPRIVPFCSYNLTDSAGNALHRRPAR